MSFAATMVLLPNSSSDVALPKESVGESPNDTKTATTEYHIQQHKRVTSINTMGSTASATLSSTPSSNDSMYLHHPMNTSDTAITTPSMSQPLPLSDQTPQHCYVFRPMNTMLTGVDTTQRPSVLSENHYSSGNNTTTWHFCDVNRAVKHHHEALASVARDSKLLTNVSTQGTDGDHPHLPTAIDLMESQDNATIGSELRHPIVAVDIVPNQAKEKSHANSYTIKMNDTPVREQNFSSNAGNDSIRLAYQPLPFRGRILNGVASPPYHIPMSSDGLDGVEIAPSPPLTAYYGNANAVMENPNAPFLVAPQMSPNMQPSTMLRTDDAETNSTSSDIVYGMKANGVKPHRMEMRSNSSIQDSDTSRSNHTNRGRGGGWNSDGTMVLRKAEVPIPVLYSAIGSLEDPSSQSLGRWGDKHLVRQARRKYEFSSNGRTGVLPGNSDKSLVSTKLDSNHMQQVKDPALVDNRGDTASMIDNVPQHLESIPKREHDKDNTEVAIDETTDTSATSILGATLAAGDINRSLPNTVATTRLRSNLRKGRDQLGNEGQGRIGVSPTFGKVVKIKDEKGPTNSGGAGKKKKAARGPIEMFRPSSDAYTPRMGKKSIKYKPAEMRTPVQKMASPLGTISRPNFRDALRRVAMIIRQHVVKIERRFAENNTTSADVESSHIVSQKAMVHRPLRSPASRRTGETDGLFSHAMRQAFSEDNFITPTYKCTMVRVPMARPGMVCGMKQVRRPVHIPTESEIYEFGHQLFKTVQLSSECSIVCLIYVERLMEVAHVPLLAVTWRPIFMCGLLLASKVWQDLSSWNIEFAAVYPQYSLDSINRLELLFLKMIKWDLYISSSSYAKVRVSSR
jgi:hypothetical protein